MNKKLKKIFKILKNIILFVIIFYCILLIINEVEVYTIGEIAKKVIAIILIYIIAKAKGMTD